jgi:hypothetical protein
VGRYSFWIHTLRCNPTGAPPSTYHLKPDFELSGTTAHQLRAPGRLRVRRGFDSARPITWSMSHSNVCTCMHNYSVLLRRRVLLVSGTGTGDDPGSTDRLWRDRGVKGKGLFCVHCSVCSVERHETSMPTRLPFAILKSGIAQAKCDRPAGGLTARSRSNSSKVSRYLSRVRRRASGALAAPTRATCARGR